MDIGSIFLIVSLLILVALFVARPFMSAKRRLSGQKEHAISSLLAQREGILRALQELDFDHTLGKIPEEDYPRRRQALLAQGAEVLRRLDALQVARPAGLSESDRLEAAIAARRQEVHAAGSTDDPLEAAIAARRQEVHAAGSTDDPLEAAIAARKRARPEKAAGFCAQCGAPLQRSDRFCPRCGAPVQA